MRNMLGSVHPKTRLGNTGKSTTRIAGMDESVVASREFFYVGGDYAGPPGEEVMRGQMYVEKLTPRDPRCLYPVVMFHGMAQTATNWMGTPDGRPGWAEYFARDGYVVYLIDQPARGRSA